MKKSDDVMIELLKKDDKPIKEGICDMIDRYNDMKGCQSDKTNFNRMWTDLDRIVDRMEQDGY